MRARIFAAVLCTAVISQINTASAQYYGHPVATIIMGHPPACAAP